jgi:aspartate/methionine/tyrosine aminotransferase
MSHVASRFRPYGTTIFAEMTALANQHGAVNLSQGFPDFDGPEFIKQAATEAMSRGQNQYGRMQGVAELNAALVARWKRTTDHDIDGEAQVTVTAGCTEALAATFLGLVEPGDEVILFEPYYDCYHVGATMSGGKVRAVSLRPGAPTRRAAAHEPGWAREEFVFDPDELRRAFTDRTRLIVVNSPHNPTGKVFTREELGQIAELCVKHDVLAVTDEVYERLTFEPDRPHLHLASFPGMAERTVTLSSLGKTYSLTGWKIGWAIASPALTKAVRSAHQFLTFCAAVPLQHGAATAIGGGEAEVAGLVRHLKTGRDFLGAVLARLGFTVYKPAGTYFIMVDHSQVGKRLGIDAPDDVEFCRRLTTKIGVAAIPPSGFYDNPKFGMPLARFAFCKKMETLERAAERLAKLA